MASVSESLNGLLRTDGALCSALVDANSGMMLGSAGSGLDLGAAAAGNTEVVRAKMRTMKSLGLGDTIEDILITLEQAVPHHPPGGRQARHLHVPGARQEPREPRDGASCLSGRRRFADFLGNDRGRRTRVRRPIPTQRFFQERIHGQ